MAYMYQIKVKYKSLCGAEVTLDFKAAETSIKHQKLIKKNILRCICLCNIHVNEHFMCIPFKIIKKDR